MITNLVSNAVKFTPAGRLGDVSAEDWAKVRVAVTDTGIGIAEEEQDKIFQRFYQVDGSATRAIAAPAWD